jgi:hypothetical protein
MLFQLKIEHPVLYYILYFTFFISFFAVAGSLIFAEIKELKEPKYKYTQNNIMSVSYMDKNADENFIIGNDGKNYIIYVEMNSDGGISEKKYGINRTTIYKTISDNETPYAKIKEDTRKETETVEMFVPQNAVVENLNDTAQINEIDKSEKEKNDSITLLARILIGIIIGAVIGILISVIRG